MRQSEIPLSVEDLSIYTGLDRKTFHPPTKKSLKRDRLSTRAKGQMKPLIVVVPMIIRIWIGRPTLQKMTNQKEQIISKNW